ncbi:protoporphyrinogen/coproporphyrinogen oxidase [Nocardia sp. NPDC058114]|uniref:protoporphyrinogen/coproporphyrinogen oxidase n=1 Tax=Nocardia sp. NPDC058114 TaxID=3346346 RepID=UPI0036DC9189
MTTASAKRYAVIGGGLSGIGAAFALHRAGHTVELLEQDAVLGGRCGFDSLGGRPIMMGGKNIGRRYHELRGFVAASGGRAYEPFGINSSQIINGELVTLDNPGIAGFLRHLLRMGSPIDAARMLYYGARVRFDERNRYLGSDWFGRAGTANDSVALGAHFGAEFGRTVLRPLTVRLNAAEPDEVYLGAFGVSLGMVQDRYDQLVDGMQPVLDWFAGQVPVRLGTRVDRLVVRDGRVIGLDTVENGGATTFSAYDGVVLATPAHAAAGLLEPVVPALSKALSEVAYYPSTVAVVQYERPFFGSTVRSIAFDSGPCSAAGVYGVNDLDIVRYTFSGRDARPSPDAQLLATWIDDAEAKVRGHLGGPAIERVRTETRSWAAAHCAYLPDHAGFRTVVREQTESVAGLQLAGDYLLGAQLEACYRSGIAAARALIA